MTLTLQPPPKALLPGSSICAYVRDSGGESQEQSIPQQKAELKAYCLQYGLVLDRIFSDEAKSAGSVAGREEFINMIEYVLANSDKIIGSAVWNYARFSRDIDDSSYYKSLLRRAGVQIFSLTDPVPDGDLGRLVETFIDLANHEKRIQTSRDVKRALRSLVEQGYAHGGFPPRGYIAEPVTIGIKRNGAPRTVSRWVIDPEMIGDVILAWRMRADGHSYAEIQSATGGRLFTSKNSWSSFFCNKSYLGIYKFGDLEFPNHHPAIIDQATWDAVQAIENAHPRKKTTGQPNHPRRQASPSLLSGVAFCENCGSAMVFNRANSSINPWPCYVCGKKQRRGYDA